jgi:hypothetical protein
MTGTPNSNALCQTCGHTYQLHTGRSLRIAPRPLSNQETRMGQDCEVELDVTHPCYCRHFIDSGVVGDRYNAVLVGLS